MQKASTVHIVDDDASFQKAIGRLLMAVGYNVRTYSSAADFLLAPFDEHRGCILLDVRLPGHSGLELQQTLAGRAEPLPVIFLSAYGDVPISVRAMKAGAFDFLTKPVDRDTLLTAIRNALAYDEQHCALRAQNLGWHAAYQTLTDREREVFKGVVSGRMNKEIAVEMGAAERTVKAHRAHVMEKMRVTSLAELVHIAEQLKPHAPVLSVPPAPSAPFSARV